MLALALALDIERGGSKAFARGHKVSRLGIQKNASAGADVNNVIFDGKICLPYEKNSLSEQTSTSLAPMLTMRLMYYLESAHLNSV
jgi:hypothetical protein